MLKKIKAGQLKGVDACMQLLDETGLGEPGKPPPADAVDSRPFAILRTFQAFHASWFPVKDLVRHEADALTTNVYDSNEMGYHLTFNLFAANARYSQIVTGRKSFRGVRYRLQEATNFLDGEGDGVYLKFNARKWGLGSKENPGGTWEPKLVEFGKLVGITPMKGGENRLRFREDKASAIREIEASKSLGAGILGTASYVLLTTTQVPKKKSDGGLSMHRSWSKAIFADLLCRNLPVVRKEDGADFVRPQSAISFRRSESCMQCHASTDSLAASIRNVMETWSAPRQEGVFITRILVPYKVEAPIETRSSDSDADFHRRPAQGRLFFRTYKGELYDRKVTGIDQVGHALADTDDLYLCAAKRYFGFMTGIDVALGDFSSGPLTETDPLSMRYRNFVIEQGLKLRQHQSLKRLIRGILESRFYAQSDYGAAP
ncbi:MAG: hypothetical protein HY074_07065 [Deltaproteobacteria bacterium]|nr:hypothetical protein [Deltaproteobacteria bacterium]